MNSQDPRFIKLKALGAEKLSHIHGDLEKHLQGTYDLLKNWGNDDYLCCAGLYHSVYGTAGFNDQLVGLEQRDEIAQVIGSQAEELVYLFAACDRKYTYNQIKHADKPSFKDRFTGEIFTLSEKILSDFSELTFANELEIIRHNPRAGRHLIKLLQPFEKYVSDNASRYYRENMSYGLDIGYRVLSIPASILKRLFKRSKM